MKKIVTKISFLLALLVSTGVSAQNARVQIVHNCANAPAVDVFVNNSKILAGVPFRAASPFIDAPAGVPLQVRIKAASASVDTANPVFFRSYTLEGGKGYYLIASGNLSPASMASNPDNIPTGFDLTVIPDAKETATNSSQVDLRIFHGATDAPTVDIKAQGVGTLVDNASFRGFSAYLPVPAASYTIQIAPAAGSPDLLAYQAAIAPLAGQSLLVLASGYFNPAANQVGGQNGPGFGIWAFTPQGTAIQLPSATARVQVVHNCANAPAVDIFVNGVKAVPGLGFRKATPFVNLNAGIPLTVAIKAASASADTSNPVFRKTYELAGDEGYTLVATGLLSTTGYAPNPNGIPVGFDITVMPGARETAATAASSNNVDVRVLHAVTDAPFVDVRVQNGLTLVNNAGFRNFTPYLSAPNADLVLEITDSAQSVVVAAFQAPLAAFADSALLVMASGFLTPSANNDGPAFGLLAVTKSGNAILLPLATSVAGQIRQIPSMVYPNPAKGGFFIRIPRNEGISAIRAIDLPGKIRNLNYLEKEDGIQVTDQLPGGFYQILLTDKAGVSYRSSFIVE